MKYPFFKTNKKEFLYGEEYSKNCDSRKVHGNIPFEEYMRIAKFLNFFIEEWRTTG
jgi:hypothetical protein